MAYQCAELRRRRAPALWLLQQIEPSRCQGGDRIGRGRRGAPALRAGARAFERERMLRGGLRGHIERKPPLWWIAHKIES